MSVKKELRNLDIFIKGIKTGKVSLIDTIPTACKLAQAVFEAKKGAYEQTKEVEKVEKLAERFLRELNRIVPKANVFEGTGIEPKKSDVYDES